MTKLKIRIQKTYKNKKTSWKKKRLYKKVENKNKRN